MKSLESLNKILENVLKKRAIILLSFLSKEYRTGMTNLIAFATHTFNKTCYVTLNDPYESIASRLDDEQKSRLFFIDCMTATIKTPETKENVVFVSSPHALTEMSIALKKVMEKGKIDFVIFDSISALLIYEQPLSVLKFVHSLILTSREADLGTSFVILKKDVSEQLMKDLAMFVDKIVEVV